MREIKFRAWSKKDESMIIGYPVIEKGEFIAFIEDITGSSWGAKEWDMKLMQYTGLKDKNGTEIYEGYIYTWGSGRNYVVEWETVDFGWDGGEMTGFKLGKEMCNEIEVIGNIYENPELLESD